MISSLLFNPISLTIFLIFSVMWLKDLIQGGRTVHSIRRVVSDHIKQMTKQDIDRVWDGLSYELKVYH